MISVHSDRILVVDDTTANLQLLTKILTEQGYTVHPASDGELAVRFVQTILPDLILLDIKMPGMDGYEVCRRLKADERTCSIPIIFISILEDEHDKVRGFQAGAVDYIIKPFQPEEVLARVSTHLRLQKLTVRLEQEVSERTDELATANQQLQQELAERQRAEALLRKSEERYRLVFENSPVSIWEEDFSLVKTLFDDLKSQGVSDIEAYFDQYPETLQHCAGIGKDSGCQPGSSHPAWRNNQGGAAGGAGQYLYPGVIRNISAGTGLPVERRNRYECRHGCQNANGRPTERDSLFLCLSRLRGDAFQSHRFAHRYNRA